MLKKIKKKTIVVENNSTSDYSQDNKMNEEYIKWILYSDFIIN